MCGIAGCISARPTTSRFTDVQKMLDLIRHRGPDSTGYAESSFGTIGHVRLSILDGTDAAAQPFVSEHAVLSYNGEVYNYLEVRKALPERPYASHSDTEVLFHSLSSIGLESTLQRIRGMFAFCWHDRSKGDTYLVRDRFGIKPLFYAINANQELVFASELKALLAVIRPPLNGFKSIYSVLGGLERDGHGTAWLDVFQVPPGHYLRFREGKAELIRYFSITDYVKESTYRELDRMSRSDLVYQLDGLLRQAVDDMGMGDIPAGSFMSGGVDSGLISYYGKDSNPDIKLFSSDVDGHQSEAHHARLNAKSIGSDLLMSTYQDRQCIDDLVSTTWHYESPLVVHFNALPLSGLSRLTRQMSTKAVLTGEGADELFIGYPHLVGGGVESLLSLPYRLLDNIYATIPGLRRFKEKKRFGSAMHEVLRHASEGAYTGWMRSEPDGAYSFLSGSEEVKHLQTAVMMKSHLLSLLWRNDRMGMMHSIESRFPFLDERVVQFAMNLPYKHKVAMVSRLTSWKHPFQSGKHLVRLVASRYLPSQIAFGVKKGFPVQGLHLIQMNPSFLTDGFLANTLGLDSAALNRFFKGLDRYHQALFGMVEIWGKLFVEGKPIEEVRQSVLKNFSYKSN